MKKIIAKFKAKTPDRNKRIGRTATAIATAIGTVLTLGVVTAPLGITILTVTGSLATVVAVYNGAQVEKD